MRRTLCLIAACCLGVGCATRYADLPPEPPSIYHLAEQRLRVGKYEDAIDSFRIFLARTADPTFRARAYYQLAVAYSRLEKPRETLDTLDRLHADFPDLSWPQVSALRGSAQASLGHRTEAFLAWEEAWTFGNPADRAVVAARMRNAVPDLKEDELLELSELITVPAVYAMIAERVPERKGAIVAAEDLTEEQLAPTGAGGAIAVTPGVEAGGEALQTASISPEILTGGETTLLPAPSLPIPALKAKVACLLPLTGPDKTYGARALSGLRLAFKEAPELLTVRDTGGDPAAAARLFDELASNPSILAVVGPLRSGVALALATHADQAELPTLLLSQRAGVSGPYVFPTSVTRTQQVQGLAGYATTELKARHFGILYPKDGYGREFMKLFRKAVRKRGAQIVGSLGYLPGQLEFGAEVARVRRWMRQRQLDAVFIPDGARVATALATDLRIEIPDLLLLGTESWDRPAILAQVADWVEGAIFADAFFAGSTTPTTRAFVEQFQDYAGRTPTVFEAEAYDAGMLVRRVLDRGAATRSQVASHLLATGRFEGAGSLIATGEGFERQLFLLRVHRGRVEEIQTQSDLPG